MPMIIEPFPHQEQFIIHPARWKALIGGYRSGKTIAGLMCCVAKAIYHPGSRGWAVAPTYPMSLIIEEAISKFVPNLLIKEYRSSLRRYIFYNDSVLEIKSAEDPERLVAFGLDYFWIDEAALVRRRAWENLTTRWQASRGRQLRGWDTTAGSKWKMESQNSTSIKWGLWQIALPLRSQNPT